jgi:hypothetical protein
MKNILVGLAVLSTVTFTSCGDGGTGEKADSLKPGELTKQQLLDSIHNEENRLGMIPPENYNAQLAMTALRCYIEFANRFPEDTATAEYLFRAADISQGLGDYQKQVEFLETIIEKHTGYRNYAAACFSAAMTYDQYLENIDFGADRATQLYQFVIDKYPDSPYADNARVLIQFVGKPDSVYDNYILDQMEKNESQK